MCAIHVIQFGRLSGYIRSSNCCEEKGVGGGGGATAGEGAPGSRKALHQNRPIPAQLICDTHKLTICSVPENAIYYG